MEVRITRDEKSTGRREAVLAFKRGNNLYAQNIDT